jgi:hypothetical protein
VTLVVRQNLVSAADAEQLRLKPTMKYVPPALMKIWDPSIDPRLNALPAERFSQLRREDRFRLKTHQSVI